MAKANVDAVRTMRGVTMYVKLKRVRELDIRLRVATWLIKLAARVLNCRIDIGEQD